MLPLPVTESKVFNNLSQRSDKCRKFLFVLRIPINAVNLQLYTGHIRIFRDELRHRVLIPRIEQPVFPDFSAVRSKIAEILLKDL